MLDRLLVRLLQLGLGKLRGLLLMLDQALSLLSGGELLLSLGDLLSRLLLLLLCLGNMLSRLLHSTIMESRSIVVISLSSLAEVVRLRASSLSSKAGIVIVCHRQQRNPGGGVRPMVVRRLSSTNWVKGLVKAEQVKCPVMGLINSNNMVTR